ncbi:MAG: hypothetical protein V3W18_14460 [candidate division Zixibacteria bacterium]
MRFWKPAYVGRALITFVFLSQLYCDNKGIAVDKNAPPGIPTNPSPGNESIISHNTNIQLGWECNDPDGDSLTYDLYFGEDFDPPLAATSLTNCAYTINILDNSKTYYWRITASDGKDLTLGRRWRFNIEMERGIHLVGSYDSHSSLDVKVIEHYAYIGDAGGFEIVDISDPTAPAYIGEFHSPHYNDSAHDIFVDGDYLYQADGNAGLQIYDISDPANPVLASGLWEVGYAGDVYVKDEYAYVASGSFIFIVDVGDPTEPLEVGSLQPGGYVNGVIVRGNLAYFSNHIRGLQIVDISDPGNPVLVGEYTTSWYSYSIFVYGDYAYLTKGYDGFQIIDIVNPAAPVFVGSYNSNGLAQDIYVADNLAYLAGGDSGLYVVNIGNPANPIEVEIYDAGGTVGGLDKNEDFLFVSLSWRGGGLLILQYVP